MLGWVQAPLSPQLGDPDLRNMSSQSSHLSLYLMWRE